MPLSSISQKRLFILGSFVVLFLAVLLYWRINSLVNSFKQVERTNQVEMQLEYALSYLKDAETGQRGFLLTHDSVFLEPFYGAHFRIDSVLNKVDSLTKSNGTQQQNFVSLQSLIDQRFDLLDLSLNTNDTSSAMRISLDRGKRSMDRIRDHINRMKHVELELMKEREHMRNRYIRLTPLSLLFLVFAMLAIIGFSYYGLTRQLQQTQRSAKALDHANNELILKNKQLENSVAELNSFNYIASHDLKEPLRKILFFTDTIVGHDNGLSPDSKQNLTKIHAAGTRMKALLDDLLTYAQASMTKRGKEQIELNALMARVVDSLSEGIKTKKAKISYSNLPVIEAVSSQMEQLFENLISNALKYSRAEVAPVIGITSKKIAKRELPASFEAAHEWYHQILFRDNGIGFSQDNAEKIFVLFQRLHQRHEFSGTGIGLTICKKIVQNHDGFITATSEINKGTLFSIYLPA